MANGWTDDLGQDTPYDQFDDDNVFVTDHDQITNWNEGGQRQWEVRLQEDRTEGLDESDYTIDSVTGEIRLKTPTELFMRDYGMLVYGGLALFLFKG